MSQQCSFNIPDVFVVATAKALKSSTSPIPIGPIEPCNTPGKFVDIAHLVIAGLDLSPSNHRRLYVRQEWDELWKKLCGTQNLYLSGPPGTGKSSLVWAWCCWFASQGNSLVWVHVTQSSVGDVMCFSNRLLEAFTIESISEFLKQEQSPLLVVDGATKDTVVAEVIRSATAWWKREMETQRLIIVSSVQYTWPEEELLRFKMEELVSHGWTFHEYQSACQDRAFVNTVKSNLDADNDATTIDEMLDAKLFFAGSSARSMFYFTTSRVIADIQEQVCKVASAKALMLGIQGDRSCSAVNHLMTTLNGVGSLVSQHVACVLSMKMDLKFVELANKYILSLSDKDKSFDEWIFQLDFLTNLHIAMEMKTALKLQPQVHVVFFFFSCT